MTERPPALARRQAMPTFPETTRKLLREWNRRATLYDLLVSPMEWMAGLARARSRAFGRLASGRVLEIGTGTGKNLGCYSPDRRIVATDLSPAMLARARDRARREGIAARFVVADAEDLPFRDAAFDAVAASFVFCTVPDPVRGLHEVARVARREGTIVLFEHMRPGGWLGALFDRLDPLAVRLMGPHINRRTMDNIRQAGLAVSAEENVLSDWVKIVVARPGGKS